MIRSHTPRARRGVLPLLLALAALASPSLAAAEPTVLLGDAQSFTVLAGTPSISNTGLTVVSGDMGISPGFTVNGFGGPPNGTVINGAIHAADVAAGDAKAGLLIAFNDASGRTDSVPPLGGSALDGVVLQSGVYSGGALSLGAGATLTLDGQNDPDAVFIIRAASSITTFAASTVSLINGAQSCNVFWVAGSSAILGTNSTFAGSILALTDIDALTGATIDGRLLARNGVVNLDSNTVTRSDCAPAVIPPVVGGGGGTVTPPGGTTTPATPVVPTATRDTTRPTVFLTVPRAPVKGSFVARVAIRDASYLRTARVYVDGRLVANLRRGVNRVTINVRGLRAGSHRLRIVVVDRAGNSRVLTRVFRSVPQVFRTPGFTG